MKPGGRIAYFNIFISHDVPTAERRRFAARNPGQFSRAEQTSLLSSAGFGEIEETDVTAEFRRIMKSLYDANGRHEAALRRQLGADFDERQRNRLQGLDGIDKGVLRRSLFVAKRRGLGRKHQ